VAIKVKFFGKGKTEDDEFSNEKMADLQLELNGMPSGETQTTPVQKEKTTQGDGRLIV